eukprot:scaffold9171_cov119-Isochrysis_galbana.AAC.2
MWRVRFRACVCVRRDEGWGVRTLRSKVACVGPVWEYELYGGAQLAPHRLYVFARFLTPPRVWEGPRAMVHLPRNARCEVQVRFPAFLCLPCLVATCLGSVLVFVLRELDPPLPPRKGDHPVGAQPTRNHM